MAVAVCPGSFDPPTNGHIDVIERAARHFGDVLVAVTANPSKEPLFSLDERIELLQGALSHLDNASISSFDGLLVDLAREHAATVIVKGLRVPSDFEYEVQMAQMNQVLHRGLDTLFMAASPSWAFVSSSLVKEVAHHGGSIDELVPQGVSEALRRLARS